MPEKEFESELALVVHFEQGSYVLLRGNLESRRECHRPYEVGKFDTLASLFLMLDEQGEMFKNYARLTFGLSNELPEERRLKVEEENRNKRSPYVFEITKVSLLSRRRS